MSAVASDPEDPHADAVRALSASDPRLAALIAKVGPCRLPIAAAGPVRARDYLAGLVQAIVSQQLSSKAAATIFARVKLLAVGHQGGFPDAAALLAIPLDELRGAGLSGAKAAYVRDLCERVSSGSLQLDAMDAQDDDAVIEALCAVRGVGRWTAEMFLMFRLGRKDILPVGDLGIQKGMAALFSLRKPPTPDRMRALARPWRPYRSIACWYLWRLNETPAGSR